MNYFKQSGQLKTHPKTLHHLATVNTELLGILYRELADSESPSVKTRAESNGTLVWVNLDITECLVKVGRDDYVDRLDCSRERLVEVLLRNLQLKQGTVDLVDDANWLDTLTKSLTKYSLGLHADTFNTVDHNESTVGNTESSSYLRGEIDVSWRVDQVDQEFVSGGLLGNILEVILIRQVGVQRDGGRFDGDTAVLLILTGIRETGFTCL